MPVIWLFLLLLMIPAGLSAQQKTLCVSVDDLPVVNYGVKDPAFQQDILRRITATFTKHQVPAIGFVVGNRVAGEGELVPYKVRMLKNWTRNGLVLGNHTYSHPNYDQVTFAAYTRDILRGDSVVRAVIGQGRNAPMYFRHPFLVVGATRERADSLQRFLDSLGYRVAPVTIDNEDYLFAKAYAGAHRATDTALMARIGRDYLTYMEAKLIYWEGQALKLFGREISQILLIHASLLNADCLDRLLDMYEKHGYGYITMDRALEDPCYQKQVTRFGRYGISWLDRWALSDGKKGDFFKGEPETPGYIVKLAGE